MENGAVVQARVRVRQLEVISVISAQCGLSAAVAWEVAHAVLGVPMPVFAPTAAVGTIVAALGQRAQRTAELLAGVGVGLLVSDVLLRLIGFGPVQTGIVVAFSVGLALLMMGRSGALVAQAGSSAVLLGTLWPTMPHVHWQRIEEAAIGGAVGLIVVGLLLPVNPMRVLDRAAAPVIDALAEGLDAVSLALAERDADLADAAADRLGDLGPDLERMHEALGGAEEVVLIAPARWKRRRDVERYRHAIDHMDTVVVESRELARWAATSLRRGEPVPGALPDAVTRLADAIRLARRDGRRGQQLTRVRAAACDVARLAGRTADNDLERYGEGMVTQLLTAAGNVLRGTGCAPETASQIVRDAAAET